MREPGLRGTSSKGRSPAHRPARAGERGRRGEEAARRYLRRQGLRALASNWRCRSGEIDLVAEDDGDLVIVEVKTRARGAARELPPGQLARLARCAPLVASAFGRGEAATVRIDLVWVESRGEGFDPAPVWMRGIDPETGAAAGLGPPPRSWWRRARVRLRFPWLWRRLQDGGRSRSDLGPRNRSAR